MSQNQLFRHIAKPVADGFDIGLKHWPAFTWWLLLAP
jgi:hypothetical protein